MSTAQDDFAIPSSFQPQSLCYDCRAPLPRDARFCPNCGWKRTDGPGTPRGHRVIDQGQMVQPSDAPSYPMPAAPLTRIGRVRTANDLPGPPVQARFPHASRPLVDGEDLDRLLLHPQRNRSGYTDSLDTLFRNSGPLGKSPQALIEEWKARSGPQVQPAANAFPDWLSPALSPDASFLNSGSGNSHNVFPEPKKPEPEVSGPLTPSDPTIARVGRVLPDGYQGRATPAKPKAPPGMEDCPECHAIGRIYDGAWPPKTCARCKGEKYVPALAQPAPDSVITAPPTRDERAMLAEWQRQQTETTAPTAVALEAVPAWPIEAQTTMHLDGGNPMALVAQPQGTGPHPQLRMQQKSDLRLHFEDVVETIAEALFKVAVQTEKDQGRLTEQRDKLDNVLQRLEFSTSEELMLLGMTRDAAEKAIGQLRKAESAAREAEKSLSGVIMALDVGFIHLNGWQDTFSSRKRENNGAD